MEAARLAVAADLARLAALCRQASAELAPARGGAMFLAREARPEPLEDRLADELADPGALVAVGTLDGVVVGYAAVHTEDLGDGTTLGVLSDLYVEEPARQVGVGEALMDAALAWCRARGCVGIDATALPGDRATKNFFETNGFTARLLVMHRRLAAEPG